MRRLAGWFVLAGVSILTADARADGLMPGDPDELVPLCLTALAAVVLVAAALYGLYRIRRAHDLLPPQ